MQIYLFFIYSQILFKKKIKKYSNIITRKNNLLSQKLYFCWLVQLIKKEDDKRDMHEFYDTEAEATAEADAWKAEIQGEGE